MNIMVLFLRRDVVQFGRYIPTFWRELLPASSNRLNGVTLQMAATFMNDELTKIQKDTLSYILR
jgi:hypothetical protein